MSTNQVLIKELIRDGHLKSGRIIKAFERIDRIHFVPDNFKHRAYADEPLPIGFGQTISQPLVVAFMLELLDPRPGDNVLEIGAGSGWKTALLAHIISSLEHDSDENKREARRHAGPGCVTAIERIIRLRENAVKNVSKFNFIENGIATIIHGNGSMGYASKAPFDKIIAGAAGKSVPLAWKEQVRVGGRIVAPVEDTIKVLHKLSPIDFKIEEYSGFRFVQLILDDGRDGG
ncbi:MAG: protein-L-isoaspartate O-methyltransferase [Patescibacteria group bacterium]